MNLLPKGIKLSRLSKNSKPLKKPKRSSTRKELAQIIIEVLGRLRSK
jgi:hypothetical protein